MCLPLRFKCRRLFRDRKRSSCTTRGGFVVMWCVTAQSTPALWRNATFGSSSIWSGDGLLGGGAGVGAFLVQALPCTASNKACARYPVLPLAFLLYFAFLRVRACVCVESNVTFLQLDLLYTCMHAVVWRAVTFIRTLHRYTGPCTLRNF